MGISAQKWAAASIGGVCGVLRGGVWLGWAVAWSSEVGCCAVERGGVWCVAKESKSKQLEILITSDLRTGL